MLTAADINDMRCSFVADPFIVRKNAEWFMFFEIMSAETGRGEVGLATSRDGLSWKYHSSVLRERFHLSYPHVFAWNGGYFMVPEAYGENAIVLYQALCFPFEWRRMANLVEGVFADATPFHFEGRWWMFACSTPYQHDTLRLYHSKDLTGPWIEHPLSPVVVKNAKAARPGGRVIPFNGGLIRYAQDCSRYYGYQLRAFEITRLNPAEYRERECSESPVLTPGLGWNEAGMHHADPHLVEQGLWLACVDGYRFDRDRQDEGAPSRRPILSRLSGWLGRET